MIMFRKTGLPMGELMMKYPFELPFAEIQKERCVKTHPTPGFRVKPGMTKKANDDF
jgi:hypothetical protein